ncbi:hypothetical protein DFH08DRAFT_1008244 [Mycena albidolilacea]|uniref:Secreted protein n=1 Tax=Mycena albidolilacea TaxID=1033008 RepID=A0AAD6ZZZ6_9AGAR|nr:hypothetical protein DFH08DRAFT_1008244 [Mycena albidolilacea]
MSSLWWWAMTWCPIGVPTLSHLIEKPVQTDPELAERFSRPKTFRIVSVARSNVLQTCGDHIREFVQKPHEPHAAFVHCAKPCDKMKNLCNPLLCGYGRDAA